MNRMNPDRPTDLLNRNRTMKSHCQIRRRVSFHWMNQNCLHQTRLAALQMI